jgi:hypothetical protein
MRTIAFVIVASVAAAAQAVPIEPRDTGNEKWASVRGQVVFSAEKVPAPIEARDRVQGTPIFYPRWVVNPNNKGVKNVFVWLATETKERGIRMSVEKIHPDLRKVPDMILEIDVKHKQFSPDSQAMRAGQKLLFKNSSNEPCDFKCQSLEIAQNVLVPSGKTHMSASLKAETYPLMVSSGIHPWMKSHVRIFDHPYFAVTDEDGKFEIRLAPVGKMRLWTWHPESGFRDGAKGRDGDLIEVKSRGTDVGAIKIKPLD